MQRFHQLLYAVSFVALNWFAMMAVHELGHVVGALVTGGTIERVVLYPLTISRTDVSPNPCPAIVVWLGPVFGCVFPLAVCAFVPHRRIVLRNMARFFAGFCLIANGAYISIGSFEQIGDCGEMLRTGTPLGAMLAFGAVTISVGLCLWHHLGSIKHFINNPAVVTTRMAYVASGVLIILVAVGFVVSPQ
jgi:hypothetical protein